MKRVASAAVVSLAWSLEAAVAEVPLSSVSFTGEAKVCTIFEAQEECASQTIYYTPARLRIDETAPSERSTVLYDAAKKTKTTIDFTEKTYEVAPLDPASDPISMTFLSWPGTWTPAGQDRAAGAAATKYAVTRSRAGFQLEGFAWVNSDNVVVRVEPKLTSTSLKIEGSYKVEVTRLTMGAFDPALLEVAIPAEFKKVEN